MSSIRSTSVGADLGHWRKYASRNNSTSKGATGESPGVKLATPTTKKATGGPVKKRADRRFAKGGKVKHKAVGGPSFNPSAMKKYDYSDVFIPKGTSPDREPPFTGEGTYVTKPGPYNESPGDFGPSRDIPDKRGGRAHKRARGGRLTAGACTGEGREEKAAMYKRG